MKSGLTQEEDRFASGYQAARRHYLNDNAVIKRAVEAWRDPLQDRGRDAIRRVWPDLATALDSAAVAADEMAARPVGDESDGGKHAC